MNNDEERLKRHLCADDNFPLSPNMSEKELDNALRVLSQRTEEERRRDTVDSVSRTFIFNIVMQDRRKGNISDQVFDEICRQVETHDGRKNVVEFIGRELEVAHGTAQQENSMAPRPTQSKWKSAAACKERAARK